MQTPQLRQCDGLRKTVLNLPSQPKQWETISNGIIFGGAFTYAVSFASFSLRKENAFTDGCGPFLLTSSELICVIHRLVDLLWLTYAVTNCLVRNLRPGVSKRWYFIPPQQDLHLSSLKFATHTNLQFTDRPQRKSRAARKSVDFRNRNHLYHTSPSLNKHEGTKQHDDNIYDACCMIVFSLFYSILMMYSVTTVLFQKKVLQQTAKQGNRNSNL